MNRSEDGVPWVLIAGSFHDHGGMDRANAELARALLAAHRRVYLVAHAVAPDLAASGAIVRAVAKPADSFFLGEWLLERRGQQVAAQVCQEWPGARVVVNGGNCAWPGINWVHCVHRAWKPRVSGGPLWWQLKSRIASHENRRRERRALAQARLVIANSERTRRDLCQLVGVAPESVRVVYLGSDARFGPVSREERAAARAAMGIAGDRPLVAFVGALGYDGNKGFDVLWQAWLRLREGAEWAADLAVAGGGRQLPKWRALAARAGLANQVHFLGVTERIPEVLAAADLLVSPVRYEAYGLNVHEAVCRGVPAIVSAAAGVAERFGPELADLLLRDPEDPDELARRMLDWRAHRNAWSDRIRPLAASLRRYSWSDMASRFIELAESPMPRTGCESARARS
jgi:glycosyltransferase involved in cell wall biosynthesis